jgi:hypothetical protein
LEVALYEIGVVGVDDLLGVACDDAVGEQSYECHRAEYEEDETEDVRAGAATVLHQYFMLACEERLAESVVCFLTELVHLRIYYIYLR